MTKILPKEYGELLDQIKGRIRSAQYDALKSVNKELIELYWDIGKLIVDKQRVETWGKEVVMRLAIDLKREFSGMSGFSPSNLWRMKSFFETYSNIEKLAPLVREIGWTHNVIIMEKCKDDLEREFYIRMTRRMGWSKNVLIHQIENQSYEKTLINQTNFDKSVPEKIRNQAKLAIKDEYTFDFLEMGEDHAEHELEQALMSRMDKFLREMGGNLAFVGSQYRLEVSNKEYFIDILLYHRHLSCLVALELKVGEFKPEYVGKMQFYLSVLDEKIKAECENPSIGIIVCKTKDKVIVEYALKDSNKPIGVSSYAVSSMLPQKLQNELPSPEQVAKLLEGL